MWTPATICRLLSSPGPRWSNVTPLGMELDGVASVPIERDKHSWCSTIVVVYNEARPQLSPVGQGAQIVKAVEAELEELGRVSLFADLHPNVLGTLARQARLQRLPTRSLLFKEGSKPEHLHLLISGAVQLSASTPEESKETIIEIATPYDSFILAAVLTDTPYLMSAMALGPVEILLLPAADLRRAIVEHNDLALTLLATMAGQSRRMLRQLKNLKLRSTVQRVGCFLLTLSQPAEGDTAIVQLPYDKQLIASQLGMTRESLSRALSALREFGVETQNDRILLKDPETLASYCGSSALIDAVEPDLRVPC